MVSQVFFDSGQLLTFNQPSKNASKYPKLACAKIAILHSTDFRGLIRPQNQILGIINICGSSLGSTRNLHIGFIMGCRGGFSRKTQKTGGGRDAIFCPPTPKITRVNSVITCQFSAYLGKHSFPE